VLLALLVSAIASAVANDAGEIVRDLEECIITASNGFMRYDLRPLGGKIYQVSHEATLIDFGLCGLLPQTCGDSGAAVCGIEGPTITPYGQYPTTTKEILGATGVDAVLVMTYSPHPSSKVTFMIEFVCPTGDVGEGHPTILGFSDSFVSLRWETSHACVEAAPTPDPEEGDCFWHVGNSYYDMSALSFIDHQANYTADRMYTFDFNVCRPISSVSTTRCPLGSTYFCQTSNNGDNLVAKTRPAPSAVLQTLNGIRLYYKDGDTCDAPGLPARQAIVDFVCGPDFGTPVITGEVSKCTYAFVWETSAVCNPINTRIPACVIDTDNIKIDFSSLGRKVWSVPNSQFPSSIEHIGICGRTTQGVTYCPPYSGVCETTGTRGFGFGEHPYKIDVVELGNRPVLNIVYAPRDPENGCGSSAIELVCDPETIDDAPPVHVSNSADGCHQNFLWKTPAVCPRSGMCRPSSNGYIFNFDVFIDRTFSAPNPFATNFTTHLVLCNQTIRGIPECAGFAACETYSGARPYELGSNPLEYVYDSAASVFTVVYTPSITGFSTRINFHCNLAAGDGKPALVSVNGQSYTYVWESEFGCPL